MFKQSITYAFLTWAKRFILSYRESAIYNFIMNIAGKIKSCFEKSFIHSLTVNESRLEKMYKTSLIYFFISSLVAGVVSFFEKTYSIIRAKAKNSVTETVFNKFHSTGIFKYEYLLGAFFVFMLIVPGSMWNNAYAAAGAFGFSFLYFLVRITGRELGTDFKKIPVSLVAFVIAIFGAMFMTPVVSDGIRVGLFFITAIIFALLIWGSISDVKTLKNFVILLVSGLFFICLYGLYQNYIGVPVDIMLTDVNTNAGMPGRVYSTFDNPNNFAEAVVILMPFVYSLIICTKNKFSKLFFLLAFAVGLGALMVSYSRSCYIAFAIASIVFALLYDWRLLVPIGILALVAIPFLPDSVTNRILTIGSMNDTSNSYRVYLWEGVVKLAKAKGLTGIGLGPEAFLKEYPPYANMWAQNAPHSHMLYLELLVELGVIGLISFIAFLLFALKKGLSVFNRTVSKDARCISIGAISALAGISFTACAEYIWFYPRVMFVYFICIGVLLASVKCAKRNQIEK